MTSCSVDSLLNESLVNLISGKTKLFQVEEFEVLMLAHESRIERNKQELLGESASVNLVQPQNSSQPQAHVIICLMPQPGFTF